MPYQGQYNNGGGYGGGGGGGGSRYGGGGGSGGKGGWRRNDDEQDPNSEQFRKLFVGGLSYETDEEGLKNHFGQWGEIVDCVVMRDQCTKKSRGFGFITYKDACMIDEAQKNRGHKIDNREVDTKRAMPRDCTGSHQPVNKMFVGGLKDDTTEEMVREVFGEFGEIESVDIVKDKNTGKVRGFCFVTYNDHDPVDKAVLIKKHELNTRKVEVKKAEARGAVDSRGGDRGGRSGGRDRSYGGNSFSGSGGFGGGYNGGYGGQSYGGGGGNFSNWGQSGGGYGDFGGGNNWHGGGGGGFGSNYQGDYSGGAMKGSHSGRSQGPYGGGYGQGGGSGGYGGYRR